MKARSVASTLLLGLSVIENSSLLAQTSPSGVQLPAPDVPANCAAFSGGWTGVWPNVGRSYLWVMSVAKDCTAEVLYTTNANPSPTQKRTPAAINGDTLTLDRPDGGTTKFEHRGNTIYGRYRGPRGFNEASMERIDTDAAARLDEQNRTQAAMVPLAAEVPPECAAFHGQWAGTWSFGQMYLRVVEAKSADGKCTVRFSYSGLDRAIPADKTAEVTGGSIQFTCSSSGSTCAFRYDGKDLQASLSYVTGGSTRDVAVFRRVP